MTLWDRVSGHKIFERLAHPPEAFNVEFSRDGRLLASGGSDGTAKLWEVIPGGLKLRHTLQRRFGSTPLFFSRDGRRLVGGSSEHTLKFWDTKTGLEVGTLYGHRGSIAGIAFARDGNTLYSGAQDGDVRIWRAPFLERFETGGNEKARPE